MDGGRLAQDLATMSPHAAEVQRQYALESNNKDLPLWTTLVLLVAVAAAVAVLLIRFA
jgi:hypothetical protein